MTSELALDSLNLRSLALSVRRYGHLNNTIFFHLIDSIINAYLIEHCGRDPQSSAQIGLVVSSHCTFYASLGFPKIADLGLRVNKLGKSSVSYEVGVFERGIDEPRAVGGYTHVFVDRSSNRPSKEGMTVEIAQGLRRLLSDEKAKL